jgi:hypothetical protein
MKKILLITYHFPPSAASGAFRLLGFARHLPTCGWQPIVVAPPTLPWEPVDEQLTEQISAEVIAVPVPYPSASPRLLRKFAQNLIWLPLAWSACARAVAEHQPDAILTSGPPHCVHALGYFLQQDTGLPWVADFRDPWISDGTGRRRGLLDVWALSWERSVFERADLILANAPNACRLFQKTYPAHAGKVVTLTNGFDPRPSPLPRPFIDSCIRLLHAGEIYAGRDPSPLFSAIARLNLRDDARPLRVDIIGRCESQLPPHDFVVWQGQRGYGETLDAMAQADILVLFDSPGRKIGVPAKLYEYLGAGRPILALAENDGDVATILRQSGIAHRIAPPRDEAAIAGALMNLEDEVYRGARFQRAGSVRGQNGTLQTCPTEQFTRASLARVLASHFDRLTGTAPAQVAPTTLEEAAR